MLFFKNGTYINNLDVQKVLDDFTTDTGFHQFTYPYIVGHVKKIHVVVHSHSTLRGHS